MNSQFHIYVALSCTHMDGVRTSSVQITIYKAIKKSGDWVEMNCQFHIYVALSCAPTDRVRTSYAGS
jgi:hypothetical protein